MKTKNCFLLLLILCSSIASLFAQSSLEDSLKTQLALERYDSAAYIYEQLVSQNPSNLQYKVSLLELYYNTNQVQKGISLAEDLSKSPALAEVLDFYVGYADLLCMAGEYEKARNLLLGIKDAPWLMKNPSLRGGIETYVEKIDFATTHRSDNPAFFVKSQDLVNTKYADFAPLPIGNTLYFESKNIVANPLGVGGFSDPKQGYPYQSTINSEGDLGLATTVYSIGSDDFENNANLAPFTYHSNSKMVVSSQNNFPAGVRHPFNPSRKAIGYMSYMRNSSIDKLASEIKDFPYNPEQAAFPHLSGNGYTLYFASTAEFRGGNYGGFDIFVTYFKNGEWTEPINLGAQVNSSRDEVSPFIDDLSGRLYFSSNSHAGFGGFDVYCAERLANRGWAKVRHLGPGVNSSADDLYFVFDAARGMGYFSSNRTTGKGDYDIYSAKFTGDYEMMPFIREEDEKLAQVDPPSLNPNPGNVDDKDPSGGGGQPLYTEYPKEDKKDRFDPDQIEKDKERNPDNKDIYNAKNTNNDPYSTKIPCAENAYIGVVIDDLTKRPVEGAWVYIQNLKNGVRFKKTTSKYGEYAVILEPQTQYEILCSREGYENMRKKVYTGDGEQYTLLGQIAMNPSATNLQGNDLGLAGRGGGLQNDRPESNEQFLRASAYKGTIPDKGYLIQIGVFKDLPPALRKELSSYANILTEEHRNLNAKVYRLGIFAEKKHAEEVLAKVKQKKDFKDAFIKSQDLSSRTSAERMNNQTTVIFPEEYKLTARNAMPDAKLTGGGNGLYDNPDLNVEGDMPETDWAKPRGGTGDVPIIETPRNDYTDNPGLDHRGARGGALVRPLEYKIQIGAYKKPESANFPNLSHVGKLEKRLNANNGLTYFYVVGGYTTLEDARSARAKTEAAGVKSAFIVAFKDGKQVPLKETVN